jgi:hypothetical protein
MSSTTLLRLSGVSLLVGAILAIVSTLVGMFGSSDPTSPVAITAAVIQLIGGIFAVLGLPGIYARQAQRAGVTGLIGLCLIVTCVLMLGVVGSAINALLLPFLATHAPALINQEPPGLGLFFTVGGLLEVVGGILLGIATMRAAVLPRWAGLLLIVGSLVQFIGDFFNLPIANPGFLLFVLGLAWLGLGVLVAKQSLTDAPVEIPGGVVRS